MPSFEELPPSEGEQQRSRPGVRLLHVLLIGVVCATLAVIIAGVLYPANPAPLVRTDSLAPGIGTAIGDAAPNFTLPTASGARLSLSDLRGHPVLLNFWYQDCPGCLAETALLEDFYRQQQGHQGAGAVVVLGINVFDDAASVRAFALQHALTYPLLLDQGQQVMNLYTVNAVPTSYFIDGQGRVRARVIGPLDEKTLREDGALIAQARRPLNGPRFVAGC
jgi:cytochrome c biogenesis protein CcmG/thiol:disulfide interchange protein DsbE